MPAHSLRRITKQVPTLLLVVFTVLKDPGIDPPHEISGIARIQAADRPAKPTVKLKAGMQDSPAVGESDKPSEVFVPPVRLPIQKIKLADGIKVEVDEYGETYQGYDFRPPMICRDWDDANPNEPKKGFGKRDPAIEVIYDSRHPKVHFKGWLRGLAVDSLGQKLYVCAGALDDSNVHICRMNFDGTNLEILAEGLRHVHVMTVDHKGGKVYFAASHDVCRMDLNGSHVEKLVTDLEDLRGVTVDTEAGHVYMASRSAVRAPRIFRIDLDGSNRILFLDHEGGNQLRVDHVHDKLYWNKTHVDTGKQISRCNLDGTKVEHLLVHGAAHWFGGIYGMDLDAQGQKLYLLDGVRRCISRMNVDGSQYEELVYGNPSGGILAVDVSHGYMYWSQYFMINLAPVERILRTRIPPIMKPVEKTAPPLITEFDFYSATPHGTVTAIGQFLKDVSHVAVVGIGTGEYQDAKYRVISDTSVEVVIPQLKQACSELALVVQGPGGVTMTLPKSSLTFNHLPSRDEGWQHFDAWAKNQKFSLVINSSSLVSEVEHCIAYVASKGYVSVRNQGESVVFLKNGAAATGSGLKHSVLFYEPFAVVHGREQIPASCKLIPVPAIRPSFMDRLIKYEGQTAKP